MSIDDPIVLVEGGVCDSLFAGSDAGYTIPKLVAAGGEFGWNRRGTVSAEIKYRTWPR
jgi:hypothetical protein